MRGAAISMNTRCVVFICLLFLVFPGWCVAEKMKVFTEELAPVHFLEDGEVKGIATEVVRAIFTEAGVDIEIEIYPWKRTYDSVLHTSNGFVYTINRTQERERLFKWIGPILKKQVYLYKRKGDTNVEVDSFEDLKKYTTAVILGHSLTKKLIGMGLREGHELIITPNKSVQMKVFLNGRAELITGNQYTICRALQASGCSLDDVEPALFVSSGAYYIGANRGVTDEMIKRLNRANEIIQQSGRIEKIVGKYMQ